VKTKRQTYIADSPPACQSDIGFAGRTRHQDINPAGVNELMEDDPSENYPARSIEYDDWILREEKKYSRLLTELKKASWFIQSNPHNGDVQSGGSKFDVGEPPNTQCDVGLLVDELMSTGLEATRLTDDEVRHGCDLTMEQALHRNTKPPLLEKIECSSINNTQQSMAFQYTLSVGARNTSRFPKIDQSQTAHDTLSESDGSESRTINRLRLEIGEPYSDFSDCDSTAATNCAGPKPSRRIGYVYPGSYRHPSGLPNPWDSVMVESVRLVLQRWRGVCSFSQTMRSNRSGEYHENVFVLRPKKRNRPGE